MKDSGVGISRGKYPKLPATRVDFTGGEIQRCARIELTLALAKKATTVCAETTWLGGGANEQETAVVLCDQDLFVRGSEIRCTSNH